MAWDSKRAEARVRKFLTTVPTVESGVTLAMDAARMRKADASGDLDELSTRRTFLVEGAHIYGQLLDFGKLVADNGHETENSHVRLLQFLNDYYRLWDAIIDDQDGHRVDYHVARMHAVISEPDENAQEQVAQAVALSQQLRTAAGQIAQAHGISARMRFGIDHGRCLAMTTGRPHERDTLYLGSPANHAAKKAAESEVEGIFLTGRAQRIAGTQALITGATGRQFLADSYVQDAVRRYRFEKIGQRANNLVEGRRSGGASTTFSFHRHTPPLAGIKFADLSPSNSVRMDMAALFADIDGFTKFVDDAISNGTASIKAAVTTVHVIREELNAVLQDDFSGKRIRFVGDCIHGCIGAGERADDAQAAVQNARLCAEGMRSSFDICMRVAEPGANLDLAVGIEYGPVPMTRLGTRGNDSVRCAPGRAVTEAERLQQSIEGGGIRIGEEARSHVSVSLRKYFAEDAQLIGYPAAVDLFATPASPTVQIIRQTPEARPHARGNIKRAGA